MNYERVKKMSNENVGRMFEYSPSPSFSAYDVNIKSYDVNIKTNKFYLIRIINGFYLMRIINGFYLMRIINVSLLQVQSPDWIIFHFQSPDWKLSLCVFQKDGHCSSSVSKSDHYSLRVCDNSYVSGPGHCSLSVSGPDNSFCPF